MKLLLINHFPLSGSGSGTYTKNIAEHMVQREHAVHIIFPENQPPDSIYGAELHPVMFELKDNKENLPFNFPCFTTHPRSSMSFGNMNDHDFSIYMEAFKNKIDVVFQSFSPHLIHTQHLWCLSALAGQYPCPCITTVHGTDLMGYAKWPHLRHFAEKAVERSNKIITISKDIHASVAAMFPNDRDKMLLMHNGYNECVFYMETVEIKNLLQTYKINYLGEKIVLFAGKLTSFKGVDVLLHAAQKYEKNNYVTIIAGSGEEIANLKQLKLDLQLKSIYFLGHVSQKELRRLYNIADVFVIPSRKEPFGLVALEAMACGAPVVATAEGGLPDFVNEDVGSLIPTDNPIALAAAVKKEIKKTSLTRRKAIAAYTKLNFTQSAYMDKLVNCYNDLLLKKE